MLVSIRTTWKAAVAALPLAFALHGCGAADQENEEAQPKQIATSAPAAPSAPPPVTPTPPPIIQEPWSSGGINGAPNDGYPDLTHAPLEPEAEKGEQGARNLLLSFARALELREYNQAWAMLGPADRHKWPQAEFARMFSGLTRIEVAVPSGTIEGGASSLYYTGPITITASDLDGRPVRLEGEAVLRRINDVDGASPAQLRWHFSRLALDWTH